MPNNTPQIPPLLRAETANALTQALSWHPLVASLNSLVLDDCGNSDYHLLLRHPALTGCVLYLAHDGDSRLVAGSLAEWQALQAQAVATGCPVVNLHPDHPALAPDQPALCALLQQTWQEHGDSELIAALLPSLDLVQADPVWLIALASDEDFYLGEALARAICLRPAAELLPLAERCSQHPHPQVAKAGQLAMRSVRKASHQMHRP